MFIITNYPKKHHIIYTKLVITLDRRRDADKERVLKWAKRIKNMVSDKKGWD